MSAPVLSQTVQNHRAYFAHMASENTLPESTTWSTDIRPLMAKAVRETLSSLLVQPLAPLAAKRPATPTDASTQQRDTTNATTPLVAEDANSASTGAAEGPTGTPVTRDSHLSSSANNNKEPPTFFAGAIASVDQYHAETAYIAEELAVMPNAPFTLQRLAEVLLDPFPSYVKKGDFHSSAPDMAHWEQNREDGDAPPKMPLSVLLKSVDEKKQEEPVTSSKGATAEVAEGAASGAEETASSNNKRSSVAEAEPLPTKEEEQQQASAPSSSWTVSEVRCWALQNAIRKCVLVGSLP